ncbi:MAG: hypothetical protein GF405_05340, partial [Candidatus Eisenbacteria bacterium]|nr:hypothetical protein [Candidatus Eisenbacteria bacterium]
MHSDVPIWKRVVEALEADIPACLLVMTDASGAVPNRPGAKLLVTGDGRRIGTVGGGIPEQTLVERATALLATEARGRSEVIEMEHTEDGVGTACSGTQTFVLLRVEPEDLEAAKAIAGALETDRPATLVIDTNGIALTEPRPRGEGLRWVERNGAWQYEEQLGRSDVVTIVGGGHASLALSGVLAPLGFRVVVLDDREGLDTMERNICAAERRIIDY